MAPASRAARVVGERVAERDDDPRRREPLDRHRRQRKLRRQGHQPDELRDRGPLGDRAEVDRRQLLERDRPRRLGVEERALEVEAQAERVVHLGHGTGGQEVARDAGEAGLPRVVDLQVDEPREDQRRARSAVDAAHLGDEAVLHDERAREGALDRVNEKSL